MMSYLIDGYNLLHAMGALQGTAGPQGLERARQRLLGLIEGVFQDRAGSVTVVFDGTEAEAALTPAGVEVIFAARNEEADDLIERLIKKASTPGQLSVVSSDRRLRQAAKRRNARSIASEDFIDELEKLRKARVKRVPGPKREPVGSPEEWLREFGQLDRDPLARQLFALEDFGEEKVPDEDGPRAKE
jgi:predicted RNA-binding protein with PIN domain